MESNKERQKSISKQLTRFLVLFQKEYEESQEVSVKIPFFSVFKLLFKYYSNQSPVIHQKNSSQLNFTNLRKLQKRLGQYFTSKELVQEFYNHLFDENYSTRNRGRKFNIVDLCAGQGEFLWPILKNLPDFIPYAVEIDSFLYFSFLLSVLMDKEVPLDTKATVLLTFRMGDAISGFSLKELNYLKSDGLQKQILTKYREKRICLLNKDIITEEELLSCVELRTKLNYKYFNWFLDFPEIFLNNNLEPVFSNNFDFIVGNPPWLSSINARKRYLSAILFQEIFSSLIHGKFNLSLLFALFSYFLTKRRGGLVLPLGILTETYSHKFREKLTKEQSLYKIILLNSNKFHNVTNEYAVILWDKEGKKRDFDVIIERTGHSFSISSQSLFSPKYLIPLIPKKILEIIKKKSQRFPKLADLCFIRRGLTLTKKYQKFYRDLKSIKDTSSVKKLIRHNKCSSSRKEGICNFQIYYNNDTFFYDPILLGAPGKPEIFEQPKIIRRNRGKQWFVALDIKGEYYVNDIFDIIIPKNSQERSLVSFFGYLCSSFVQYFAEGFIQRDITSNFVRNLPVFIREENEEEIYLATKKWLANVTKKSTKELRYIVDDIIFSNLKLPNALQEEILSSTPLRWYDS